MDAVNEVLHSHFIQGDDFRQVVDRKKQIIHRMLKLKIKMGLVVESAVDDPNDFKKNREKQKETGLYK